MKLSKNPIVEFIVIALAILIPIIFILVINYSTHYYNERDAMLLNISIAKNDSSSCFKIKDDDVRNTCILAMAKHFRDITLCEKMIEKQRSNGNLMWDIIGWHNPRRDSTNNRENCINEVKKLIFNDAVSTLDYNSCKGDEECIYQIVMLLNDTEKCKKLDKNKNSCLIELAKRKKELKLCAAVTDNNTAKECYYYFTSFSYNPALCALISEDNKPTCYYNAAINHSKIEYCNSTGPKEADCVFNIAKTVQLPSYCLAAKEKASECFMFFAFNLSNHEFCRASPEADKCYYEFAIYKNNSEACMFAESKKKECYTTFAVKWKLPAICFKILSGLCTKNIITPSLQCTSADEDISNCIYDASLYDATFCGYITDESQRYNCYRNVAIETLNPDLCESARNFSGACLLEIARKTNQLELNPNLCKFADFSGYCFLELAKKTNRLDLCKNAGVFESECFDTLPCAGYINPEINLTTCPDGQLWKHKITGECMMIGCIQDNSGSSDKNWQRVR